MLKKKRKEKENKKQTSGALTQQQAHMGIKVPFGSLQILFKNLVKNNLLCFITFYASVSKSPTILIYLDKILEFWDYFIQILQTS
jgi:hypothetical protein